MKIEFISQNFHPEHFSNNAITQYLNANGHSISVLTAVPNYPKGEFFSGYSNTENTEEDWEGIQIHRVKTVARGQGKICLILNYLAFAFFGTLKIFTNKCPKPDVILVSQLSPIFMCVPGIFLKWRTRAPLVYWVQDIWPESALYTLKITTPLIVKPLTKLCGWIYRRADLILVQSAAFPAMIERFGIDSEKIRVFPNTAPNKYKPMIADADTEIGKMMPTDGFNLMFAGNIGESQDFDTYLEAANLLRERSDLNWVIVGSGRDMERVQVEVSRLGLENKFHFLGRHPEDDMPEFFSHADAMLVGLKDNDIFRLTVPYKIQCYMACGKPIIASLNGEGARIIQHANAGLTAAAENPEELALQIVNLIEATAVVRDEMGDNGRSYFLENYHADIVYKNLETWLQQAALPSDDVTEN